MPKGWHVLVSFIGVLHGNAEGFANPDKFDPDTHFVKARNGGKSLNNRFAFLPFGAGPRICVGKPLAVCVLKTWLSIVTRTLTWQMTPNPPPYNTMPLPHPTNGGITAVTPWEPAPNEFAVGTTS